MKKIIWGAIWILSLPCLVFSGEKFDRMTPAEHLKFAKDAISKGVVVPAKMHLDAIPTQSKEYEEAKKLYPKIGEVNADARRRQQDKSNKLEAVARHVMRKNFAATYQSHLLDNGMDAYVSTHGKQDTTLKVKFILISRPLIHKLTQQGDYWLSLKNMGFKKVIFTNGFNDTWEFNP